MNEFVLPAGTSPGLHHSIAKNQNLPLPTQLIVLTTLLFRRADSLPSSQPMVAKKASAADAIRALLATRLGRRGVIADNAPPFQGQVAKTRLRRNHPSRTAVMHSGTPPTRPMVSSCPPAPLPAPPDVWPAVRRPARLPPKPPQCKRPSGSSCICHRADRQCGRPADRLHPRP